MLIPFTTMGAATKSGAWKDSRLGCGSVRGRRLTAALVGLLIVVTFAFSSAGCDSYRETALQRSTAVPANLGGLTDEQVQAIVTVALAKRGWSVVRQNPGRTIADLNERQHRVRIDIVVIPQGFSINYVDSQNLRYVRSENGYETIHRKYATWIKNLSLDLQVALASVRAGLPAAGP